MTKKLKKGDKRLGNQFWKIRSKHGRETLFGSPQNLETAAYEYFEWADNTPLKKEEKEQVDGNIKKKKTQILVRPYSLRGLCLYLGCSHGYFHNFKSKIPKNEEDRTEIQKDYMEIIERIEDIIYTQKRDGAVMGLFKENIIARELGLKEHTENKETSISYNVDINKDEAREISDALEEEC